MLEHTHIINLDPITTMPRRLAEDDYYRVSAVYEVYPHKIIVNECVVTDLLSGDSWVAGKYSSFPDVVDKFLTPFQLNLPL